MMPLWKSKAHEQAERFWSKADTSGSCWMWTGGRDKDGIREQLNDDGQLVLAGLSQPLVSMGTPGKWLVDVVDRIAREENDR